MIFDSSFKYFFDELSFYVFLFCNYLVFIMRSLYVDDIPGAKPTHRYYDKVLLRHRHDVQVERFGKKSPDEKRVIEWYKPLARHVEPIQRNDFPLKPLNHLHQSQVLSNPQILNEQSALLQRRKFQIKVIGKVTEISPRSSKSSILSGSGLQSLSNSVSLQQNNPYFPHMYGDKNMGYKNKWAGTRFWVGDQPNKVNVPKEFNYQQTKRQGNAKF